jgi:FkbM family methyltransferase
MPATTKFVLIEIGCSDMFTMDVERMDDPHLQDTFLISFEPLLEKYAVLLARGTNRFHPQGGGDRSVPLAHHHQRGVVLPLAVSPQGGQIDFKVSDQAGCSSMLTLNQSAVWAGDGGCLRQLDTREVPSITLDSALGLAGRRQIMHLKLDVQGVDLSLIRSVDPRRLRRQVQSFSMEVVADDCPSLYVGQPHCSEVIAYARSIGYKPNPNEADERAGSIRCAGWRLCEENKEISCDQVLCERDFNFDRRHKQDM